MEQIITDDKIGLDESKTKLRKAFEQLENNIKKLKSKADYSKEIDILSNENDILQNRVEQLNAEIEQLRLENIIIKENTSKVSADINLYISQLEQIKKNYANSTNNNK